MALPAAIKVSALTAASAATGTEVMPVVQSGATVKMTLNQIKTYFQTAFASVFASAAQGVKTDSAVQYTGVVLANYANDAAAAAGTPVVPVGGLYRNGSVVMVRVV